MKYLRYYLKIFKMSLMNLMINRENFFTWVIVHTLSLLSLFAFFKLIYQQVVTINGWTQYQSLLVLGVGTLITGLGSMTFFSFMYQFSLDLQNGDYDFKLTKPLDPHFLAAFPWVDTEDLAVVPNSLILIIYALRNLATPISIINVLVFCVMIISSLIILFSVLTLLQSLAFKAVKIESMTNLFWSLVNTGKYPTKSIKNISVLATVTLMPIAIISTVPSEVLFGRFELPWIAASMILSLTLLILSRRVFMSALKHYSSASS